MLKSEKTPVTSGQPPDRRSYTRVPVRSVAYIELDDDNAGLILNISEGGIGVQSAEMITGDSFQRMILRLPKLEKWIEAGGKIAWLSPSRKEAGIQFVDLSDEARQQIQNWIYSSSFRAGLPIDQGHFKIVWESTDQEASPAGSVAKDDVADLDAMFPSEKTVPPTRHPRVENDANIVTPSLDLGIAPGPVKRQVIPPAVPTSQQEVVLAKQDTTSSHSQTAQPQATEPFARRSYHYPPLAIDPKSSGDPFASIAQDAAAVSFTAAPSSERPNDRAPRAAAPAEPINPTFPLREHYRGLGYNPTPFEEPSGKGWLIATIVLIVLLGVGAVMAIGPNNVKATVSRHIQAISAGGPPPPAGATDKSQEAATTEAPPDSSAFGGAPPQPLTNPGVNPAQQTAAPPAQAQQFPPQVEAPPTTTTVTGKPSAKPPLSDTGAGDGASQNLSARAEASAAEPPEDSEAITRRFQMEHSGSNAHNVTNSDPAPAYQAPAVSHDAQSGIASAASPLPETNKTTDARSQPAPAPAATSTPNPGSSTAAGTVAVSSHFRSLRGEEPEATRERQGLAVGQLISIHQPAYPLEAERSRTEGVVQLRATVDQLGKVEIVHAVSGPPVLLAAAIDAVREWRYAPTTVNGKAVESVNDVNVVFRLGNSAASPR